MVLIAWCMVGTGGGVAWVRDLGVSFGVGVFEAWILVGSNQENGIHVHTDLTVLGWWRGKNYGTGVVSFNGLGLLG